MFHGQYASGQIDQYKAFVNACLSEYDLDGWTVGDLCSFEDLRKLKGGFLNR